MYLFSINKQTIKLTMSKAKPKEKKNDNNSAYNCSQVATKS